MAQGARFRALEEEGPTCEAHEMAEFLPVKQFLQRRPHGFENGFDTWGPAWHDP